MTLKRMSAAERAQLEQLAAASAAAQLAIKEHQAVCYDCRPGRDWHKRACPRGWDLAKTAHHAAHDHRALLRGDPPYDWADQETLW